MLCDEHKLKGFNVFRHRNYLDIGGHARECHASRVTVVLSACSLRTCEYILLKQHGNSYCRVFTDLVVFFHPFLNS